MLIYLLPGRCLAKSNRCGQNTNGFAFNQAFPEINKKVINIFKVRNLCTNDRLSNLLKLCFFFFNTLHFLFVLLVFNALLLIFTTLSHVFALLLQGNFASCPLHYCLLSHSHSKTPGGFLRLLLLVDPPLLPLKLSHLPLVVSWCNRPSAT